MCLVDWSWKRWNRFSTVWIKWVLQFHAPLAANWTDKHTFSLNGVEVVRHRVYACSDNYTIDIWLHELLFQLGRRMKPFALLCRDCQTRRNGMLFWQSTIALVVRFKKVYELAALAGVHFVHRTSSTEVIMVMCFLCHAHWLACAFQCVTPTDSHARYTLGGIVCLVFRSCSWRNR